MAAALRRARSSRARMRTAGRPSSSIRAWEEAGRNCRRRAPPPSPAAASSLVELRRPRSSSSKLRAGAGAKRIHRRGAEQAVGAARSSWRELGWCAGPPAVVRDRAGAALAGGPRQRGRCSGAARDGGGGGGGGARRRLGTARVGAALAGSLGQRRRRLGRPWTAVAGAMLDGGLGASPRRPSSSPAAIPTRDGAGAEEASRSRNRGGAGGRERGGWE